MKKKGGLYNQTASKAEQIALCQFIRDGHLSSQIRKARKLYMNKSRALCEAARCVFEDHARVEVCASGLMVRLEIASTKPVQALLSRALEAGIAVRLMRMPAKAPPACCWQAPVCRRGTLNRR